MPKRNAWNLNDHPEILINDFKSKPLTEAYIPGFVGKHLVQHASWKFSAQEAPGTQFSITSLGWGLRCETWMKTTWNGWRDIRLHLGNCSSVWSLLVYLDSAAKLLPCIMMYLHKFLSNQGLCQLCDRRKVALSIAKKVPIRLLAMRAHMDRLNKINRSRSLR